MANTQVEVRKTAPAAANGNYTAWNALHREFDQMFDRFAGNFAFPPMRDFSFAEHFWPRAATAGVPVVDMTGDEKAYKIYAELPGVDEKDVQVTLGEDYLFIKAEKYQAHEDKAKDKYVAERSYGLFQRTFALPVDIDRTAIDARFAKGVLTVVLPRTAGTLASVKKIDVKAA